MAALRVEKKERRKWKRTNWTSLSIFEARPCIWDIFCKEYSKRDAKEKALNEISEQFDVSAEEVKSKWISLRAKLNAEFKKLAPLPKNKCITRCGVINNNFGQIS